MLVMLNGAFLPSSDKAFATDSITALDRLNMFGDGVFETMLVKQRRVHLLDYHVARLKSGLSVLKMDLPDEVLHRELDVFLSGLPARDGFFRLKLVVSRGANNAGYSTRGAQQRRFIMAVETSLAAPISVSMIECETRLGLQPKLSKIKHCNRVEQVLAKIEQEASDCDEGLLLSQSGKVVESVSSNIFILEKDKFITPVLDDCGVEGVMRNFLLRDIFPALGFTCSEEDISLQRLFESDAGFLCNSILGVRSIHSCKKLSGEQVLFTDRKRLVAVQEAVSQSYQNI